MTGPVRPVRPAQLQAASRAPLVLAAQGFFWVGGERVQTDAGPALRAPMYVEYWIPPVLAHPWPLVLVHGGGGQGLDFLGTADGREGWVHWFVRRGYAVYVVDRPGHGRAPFHPDVLGEMGPPAPVAFLEQWFTRPEAYPDRYPQARLHSQWPGNGRFGDAMFDHFLAGTGPSPADLAQSHRDLRAVAAALLDAIGPSVLLTHSAGAPMGWLAADACPEAVKAIIALEPLGPPFCATPRGHLAWGLTAAPMAFEPPAGAPEELRTEPGSAPHDGALACLRQRDPPRRLTRLAGIPVVVVTAHASWKANEDHGTVDFLRQAGVSVEHLRLDECGIHGNGHAMMLERNSDEIAAVLDRWIRAQHLD